jgi:hypothetical protein
LVLGFQGRSQLEQRYGPEAETMLSQPMTKVFLRTSEPRAADWISKAIGEVEVERLRDSHTHQKPALLSLPWQSRDSESVQLERKTEPLVMASVIGGLPDLTGYIKSQNLVVRTQFPYIGVERRMIGFLPRHMPALDLPEAEAIEPGAIDIGSGSQMEHREIEVSVSEQGNSA